MHVVTLCVKATDMISIGLTHHACLHKQPLFFPRNDLTKYIKILIDIKLILLDRFYNKFI